MSLTQVTPLVKIETLLCEAGWQEVNKRRFGLKTCVDSLDMYYLNELREIYIRASNLEDCDTDQELDSCLGCDLDTITETIQTI